MAAASTPQITVQSPGDGSRATGSPAQSPNTDGGVTANGRGKVGGSIDGEIYHLDSILSTASLVRLWLTAIEGKPVSNGKSFPNKLIRNLSSNHVIPAGHGAGGDGRRDSQIAIDPLSQVRTRRPSSSTTPAHTASSYSISSNGHIQKA